MKSPLINFIKKSLQALLPVSIKKKIISSAFFLVKEDSRLLSHFETLANPIEHIERAICLVAHFKLNPINNILDIGGASGKMAVVFAKKFPNAKIFTFEPIKKSFDELIANINPYKNIIPINKGVGAEIINNAKIHKLARITSSSLCEVEESIVNDFFSENLKNIATEEIQITTLDAEIPIDAIINILKIDVQGYEIEVLKGAEKTLERVNIILVEVQNHHLYKNAPKYFELDAYIRSKNFSLYDIIPSIRQDKKLYEWDSIYINNNLLNLK